MRCILNKITDILPIAQKNVLEDIETLCCFCGCNRCILNGKIYYNKPKSFKAKYIKCQT